MITTFKYRDFYISRHISANAGDPIWVYELWGTTFTKNGSELIHSSAHLEFIQKLKSKWEALTAEGWKDEQPNPENHF